VTVKNVLKQFNIGAIYGIDFETYWDPKDYSLKKMATTEYIFDPRFKSVMAAVMKHDWKKPRVFSHEQFIAWLKTVDWQRTGMLAHHAQFDGLILSHHYGVKPAAYFDTLSMARPIMPVSVGGSLQTLCSAFGRASKTKAGALIDTAGKRDLSKAEYRALAAYAGDDIEDAWFLFNKFLPFTQPKELRLIHTTVKMYAQPRLLINKKSVDALHTAVKDNKANLLETVNTLLPATYPHTVSRETVTSSAKLGALLLELGYDPPTKVSRKTGKIQFAFAKNNEDFKLFHKQGDKLLKALLDARLALSSSILETRTARMSNRSKHGVQPIYLKYWGAKTGRWSGGDKANWQNLTRGSDMRKAVYAPRGYKLIIADLAQIEVRVNAWMSNQKDLIHVFATKGDPYCLAASKIYSRPIDKNDDPDERFIGKVATIMLGYGAGGAKFAEYLRLGMMGPAVDMSDEQGKDIVNAWRRANHGIVANWRHVENCVRSAFLGKQELLDEVLTYRGENNNGITELPDGTYIRYDDIRVDERGLSHCNKSRLLKNGARSEERQYLYGGLLVENNTQALSRSIIAAQMLAIEDALPTAQIVMSTHDELVLIVTNEESKNALKVVKRIMSTSPDWAPTLPLDVEAHASQRYDK
jgi:DNA polymerase